MDSRPLVKDSSLTYSLQLTLHTDPHFHEPQSKIERMGKELLASLNNHASEAKTSDAKLISSLPSIREDCVKIHDLCQRILNSDAPVENEALMEMTAPLLRMAEQLRSNKSPEVTKALDQIHSEINEIRETIQFNSYSRFREKLQNSVEAWDAELSSIEAGDMVDCSSKKYFNILEQLRALIYFSQQAMRQEISPSSRKHLINEITSDLNMVLKAQGAISQKINTYFEMYINCAKTQVEQDREGSPDFHESLSTFAYFDNGLKEAIAGMESFSNEWQRLIAFQESKLPFNKEINKLAAVFDRNRNTLEVIRKKGAINPAIIQKYPDIDSFRSLDSLQIPWNSLRIHDTIFKKYPEVIYQRANRAINELQCQLITPENSWTSKPPPLLVSNIACQTIAQTFSSEILPDTRIQSSQAIPHKIKSMNVMPLPLAEVVKEVNSVAGEALERLRHAIALMGRTLEGSVSTNLTEMEQLIARLMDEARSSLEDPRITQEAAKCGPKHQNLIRLAQLFEGLKLERVVVPIPHGIPSEMIEHFLRQRAPQLFEKWEKLGTLYANYKGDRPFLEQEGVIKFLQSIDQAIEEAFLSAGNDEALFQGLIPPDFPKWLETIKKNGNFLMVRSSGAEDSRQSANAGGNVSANYVSPDFSSVSKAIGDVVRSYFGYASLQNRINAGLNPFEKNPQMAVTVQELIGEPIGGSLNPAEIPVSMVLFTSEPLYIGGEEFRIMRISAGYGHGEGVVGNKGIATDTVLLLVSQVHPNKLYILYDNRPKPERLTAVSTPEGVLLQARPLPDSMQNRPALDDALLQRSYLLGVVAEKFFNGHPTDMEIVIKGGTIFVVQARPINRPDLIPTYIDLKKAEALGAVIQKYQSEVIVPGEGSVVIMDRRDEFLYAPTLEQAEKAFKKNRHKVAIVTQPEPANSHPVVNFSGLGLPCFEVQEDIQGLLKKVTERNLLVVDTQRGVINLWDEEVGSVKECIVKGFAVHPAKIAISLPLAANLPVNKKGQGIPQEVKDLIISIQSATTQDVALAKLKELREHELLQNLRQRKQELKARVKELTYVPSQLREGLQLTKQLIKKVEEAFAEAEIVFERNPHQRLHPLFHVKVIEKLLVAPSAGKRGVGQYTVVDIEPIHRNLETLIDYQKSLSRPAYFADLLMLGSHGITPETEIEWRDFLRDCEFLVQSGEITKEQVLQFKQMMKALETMDVLPTWFALFFPQVSRTDLAPRKKLEKLLETFPPKEAAFFNYFLDLHQILMIDKEKINLFGQLESFESGWDWLQGQVEKVHSQAIIGTEEISLERQLKSCSPVSKILVVKVLHELVDTYDLSIKAMIRSMKGNPTIDFHQKNFLFKRILKPYLGLLLDWGKGIADPKAIPIKKNARLDLSLYLGDMERVFNRLEYQIGNPCDDPFEGSEYFSVNAAMLGSNTDITNNSPKKCGDLFTLIHQDLQVVLNSISQLNNPTILQQALIPNLLKDMFNRMREFPLRINRHGSYDDFAIQMISLDINDKVIVAKYNIPLRDHATTIFLRHDNRSGEIELNGLFLGEGTENHRWSRISTLLSFLDKSNQLNISEPTSIASNELKFSWKIKDLRTLLIAQDWIRVMVSITFEEGSNDNLFELLWQKTKMKKIELDTLCDTVVKAANIEMTDIDYSIRLNASRLLVSLYVSRHIQADILEKAAYLMIKDEEVVVRKEVVNVCEKFSERDGMYHKAVPLAFILIRDENADIRLNIIKLFSRLKKIEQKKVDYDTEAVAIAIAGIRDKNKKVRDKAFKLFTLLLTDRGIQNWDLIKTAIDDAMNDENPNIRDSVSQVKDRMNYLSQEDKSNTSR